MDTGEEMDMEGKEKNKDIRREKELRCGVENEEKRKVNEGCYVKSYMCRN